MGNILFKDESIVGANLTQVEGKQIKVKLDKGNGPQEYDFTLYTLSLSVNAKHVPPSAYFDDSPTGELPKFKLHIMRADDGSFREGKVAGVFSDPMTEADMDAILEMSGFNAKGDNPTPPYEGVVYLKLNYWQGAGKKEPKNFFKEISRGDGSASLASALSTRKVKPAESPKENAAAGLARGKGK